MKKILSVSQWIILLASIAFLGIGFIQANWIYQGHLLKQEEIDLRLKAVTPEIAKTLKNNDLLNLPDLLEAQEPIPIDPIDLVVDSMLQAKELLGEYNYAIFQQKENGIFKSNKESLENELRNSKYQVCVTCIVTFNFIQEKVDMDTLTASTIANLKQKVRPAMTTIRSLEETLSSDNHTTEEILWFAIFIPNQSELAFREIFSQLILTILLMGMLLGLFFYTLKMLSKQKKLSQVKDDFFNNMTHEFKTPLSSIRLASTVLKQNKNEEKKEIYLNLIANESKRLEGQVDKILQLSLIESGDLNLQKETVDFNLLVQNVISRLKLIIEQQKAEVKLNLTKKEFSIEGDQTHLSNCIYNLVENSLKYAGESPKISIATFFENGKKIISIKDDGRGIPKEFQAEIFDRFFRGQKKNQYQGQGFGIGLSYVKTIVEAHHGSIKLNGEYREGCEFIVMF